MFSKDYQREPLPAEPGRRRDDGAVPHGNDQGRARAGGHTDRPILPTSARRSTIRRRCLSLFTTINWTINNGGVSHEDTWGSLSCPEVAPSPPHKYLGIFATWLRSCGDLVAVISRGE